jgi:predicted DNA-binding transcriptional regulator AlpA
MISTTGKKVSKHAAAAQTVIHHPPRKSFHIDKRAASIIAAAPKEEAVFDTKQLAAWLGLSPQFLEIARCKGYGPDYVVISPRVVRYRKSDVIKWLEQRTEILNKQYSSCDAEG